MGTYRWNGWRLDIEVAQGTAQRLIFTMDIGPISEVEERQLLNENGGMAAWQPADHVATDALAARKWHRTSDGAEAFTLANDNRVMCLVTGAWAAAWTKAHPPVLQPSTLVQGGAPKPAGSSNLVRGNSPTVAASPIPGLMVLAGFVGLIVFVG